MKILLIIFTALLFTGCTTVPYEELNLDTTSNITMPTKGRAGIYVYRWKTGIYAAILDTEFEIKGYPIITLNTGEYGYFEIEPSEHEVKSGGGLYSKFKPMTFHADQNYFFRGSLKDLRSKFKLVRKQSEIDDAKKNIVNKRYELYSVD